MDSFSNSHKVDKKYHYYGPLKRNVNSVSYLWVLYNTPMPTPILATKLFIPPPPPKIVSRPRLIQRMNEGLHRKLTLISAPAGFGKTTLVSEWVNNLRFTSDDLRLDVAIESQIENRKSKIVNQVAWLSLDEGDNDPARFLAYFVAALQTIVPAIGEGLLALLQSAQPPPSESILTTLLNPSCYLRMKFAQLAINMSC